MFAIRHPFSVVSYLLILLLTTGLALTAGVPVARASIERVIVVDQNNPDASDLNGGTEAEPLLSIQTALNLARDLNLLGIPVRVSVRAGTYRESLTVPMSSTRSEASLTIEGTSSADVVVSGADVWRSWSRESGTDVYRQHWPHDWGFEPVPASWDYWWQRNNVSDVARRREVVWLHGDPIRQVLSRSELVPGSFYVDEAADSIYVQPADTAAFEEAAAAGHVEGSVRERVLDVDSWPNLTIRNISFEKAASPIQEAAVRIMRVQGLTIADAKFEWNNWTALAIQRSTDIAVTRTALDHNGVMGLSAFEVERMLVEDVSNSYNNTWRGAWADYKGWADSSKFFRGRDITVRRWHGVGNAGNGMWFDTDLRNVVVEDAFLAHNGRRGISFEAMRGPAVIRNSVICGNQESGVLDAKSDATTVEGNSIFDNIGGQILFSGKQGGRDFTEYDTGQMHTVRSENWTIQNNRMAGSATGERLVANQLSSDDWAYMLPTLVSAGNDWSHQSLSRPFTVPGRVVSFQDWQGDTGLDIDSSNGAAAHDLRCEAPSAAVEPSPSPSPSPAPEPSPTAEELMIELGESGQTETSSMTWPSTEKGGSKSWSVEATSTVTTTTGAAVADAIVVGTWSHDSAEVSCVTSSAGTCSLSSGNIPGGHRSVTLTVSQTSQAAHGVAPGQLPASVTIHRQ